MPALRRQRKKLGRYRAFGRAFGEGQHASARFIPQDCQLLGGGTGLGVRHVTQLADRSDLQAQQITVHQMRQVEVGVIADQLVGLVQCFAVESLTDESVDVDQPGFGLSQQRHHLCDARIGQGVPLQARGSR